MLIYQTHDFLYVRQARTHTMSIHACLHRNATQYISVACKYITRPHDNTLLLWHTLTSAYVCLLINHTHQEIHYILRKAYYEYSANIHPRTIIHNDNSIYLTRNTYYEHSTHIPSFPTHTHPTTHTPHHVLPLHWCVCVWEIYMGGILTLTCTAFSTHSTTPTPHVYYLYFHVSLSNCLTSADIYGACWPSSEHTDKFR